MFTPPYVIVPESVPQSESISLAMVLLPEPDGPTIAAASPYLISILMPCSTSLPLGSHTIIMYDNVKVRIVKFVLPSGEIETLMTNLFDLKKADFKELYFKRWRIEVKYDIVKNKLEMPCFGGFSENVIMQDFWISMYLANMAAIAKNEADEQIREERLNSDNRYEYQANVNTLIGSLRDRLADAVFSRNPLQRERILNRIISEIQKSVVPIRPDDGKTPRYENPRQGNFHHNKRSNL